ncbi:uncharacterized protein [Clytia hemisphaerica]|uniref:C2H2-type domain-containing protein n=1 Tax=Clytia hemisphaerica TaxID=252671 RepID=A0A7M5WKQ8_9CNID
MEEQKIFGDVQTQQKFEIYYNHKENELDKKQQLIIERDERAVGEENNEEEDEKDQTANESSPSDYEFSLREENIRLKSKLEQAKEKALYFQNQLQKRKDELYQERELCEKANKKIYALLSEKSSLEDDFKRRSNEQNYEEVIRKLEHEIYALEERLEKQRRRHHHEHLMIYDDLKEERRKQTEWKQTYLRSQVSVMAFRRKLQLLRDYLQGDHFEELMKCLEVGLNEHEEDKDDQSQDQNQNNIDCYTVSPSTEVVHMNDSHLDPIPSVHKIKVEERLSSPTPFSHHDEHDQSRYHQTTEYNVLASRDHERTPAHEVERSRDTNSASRDEIALVRAQEDNHRSRDETRESRERLNLMERMRTDKHTPYDRFTVSPHERTSRDHNNGSHDSARDSAFDHDAFFRSKLSRRHHAPERPHHSPQALPDHSEHREHHSFNSHDHEPHVSQERRRQDHEPSHETEQEHHPPKVFVVDENRPQTITHTTGSSPTPPAGRHSASNGSKQEYSKQDFSSRDYYESKSTRDHHQHHQNHHKHQGQPIKSWTEYEFPSSTDRPSNHYKHWHHYSVSESSRPSLIQNDSEHHSTYERNKNVPKNYYESMPADAGSNEFLELKFDQRHHPRGYPDTSSTTKISQHKTYPRLFETTTSSRPQPLPVGTPLEEKKIWCLTCDGEVTKKPCGHSSLVVQEREKEFPCPTCRRVFNNRSHLKRHNMIHSGEKPWACTYCDKRFNRKSHLNRHVLTHTGEKPFKCPYCGKGFADNSDLKRHKQVHESTPGFVPSLPAIRPRQEEPAHAHPAPPVISPTSIQQMISSHHSSIKTAVPVFSSAAGNVMIMGNKKKSEAKFPCNKCGKVFTRKSHLTRHKLTHEQIKIYCDCGRLFRQKAHLQAHLPACKRKREAVEAKYLSENESGGIPGRHVMLQQDSPASMSEEKDSPQSIHLGHDIINEESLPMEYEHQTHGQPSHDINENERAREGDLAPMDIKNLPVGLPPLIRDPI